MVKHIIIWTLKELSAEEKSKVKAEIKAGLESLKCKVPQIKEIKVITDGLPTSTGDLMLDSTFESAEDLAAYSRNPQHLKVADEKVRPYAAHRACLDFEI